jgi:ABC-type multidrug transport system fused ATPase/permease subunit
LLTAFSKGTLTIGGLVIFLAYLGQLYNPLLSKSGTYAAFVQGQESATQTTASLP